MSGQALAPRGFDADAASAWFTAVCEQFDERAADGFSAPSGPMGLELRAVATLVGLDVDAPWGHAWSRFAVMDVGDRRDVLWCSRPDRPARIRMRELVELAPVLLRRYGGFEPDGWGAADEAGGWLGWVR